MDFRIYYADGSTFDGRPEDAPKWGVQVIVQNRKTVGRELLRYFDYFLYVDGCWVGVIGHDSLLDQVVHRLPDIRALTVGRMINPVDFDRIYKRANTDPDFPKKSATHKGEKPA